MGTRPRPAGLTGGATLVRVVTERRFAEPHAPLARAVSALAKVHTGGWVRYGLPLALTAVTLAGVDALSDVLPGGGAFLLLLAPVTLGAVALGARPALAIMLLGGAGALLLVPLRGHPWLSQPSDAVRLVLFLAEGALLVAVGGTLRSALRTDAQRRLGQAAPVPRLIEPLTDRELEILRLAATGMSVEGIGRRLYLSRNTVKSHLAHAYAKLGAHNRAEAIAAGLHWGCLERSALAPPATHVALRQD
jgi:DNA-binding CsgD family transcriptional regulator